MYNFWTDIFYEVYVNILLCFYKAFSDSSKWHIKHALFVSIMTVLK